MPSPGDPWRTIAYAIRAIPGQFGLRPYTVEILGGIWETGTPGRGDETQYRRRITEGGGQNPKVREASAEEIALGSVSKGSIIVGPVTPNFGTAGLGTPLTALQPTNTEGETLYLVLTGPGCETGMKYRITDVDKTRAIHWTIYAEPVTPDGSTD